jgi:hypothetical protein
LVRKLRRFWSVCTTPLAGGVGVVAVVVEPVVVAAGGGVAEVVVVVPAAPLGPVGAVCAGEAPVARVLRPCARRALCVLGVYACPDP